MPLITKDGVLLTANGEFLNNKSIADVQVNGTTVVEDGIANIPVAKIDSLGLVKVWGGTGGGLKVYNDGTIYINAATNALIDGRTDANCPVVASNVKYAVDSVLCSTSASEALTESQQEAAKDRLGIEDGITDVTLRGNSIVTDGVAVIPMGGVDVLGAIKLYGAKDCGLAGTADGAIKVSKASDAYIDARTNNFTPIVPGNLKYAVDSILCSANVNEALTDTQKAAAQARLGISGGAEKPWVLKATWTDPTQKCYIDLTGCKQFFVIGTTKGTASVAISCDFGNLNVNFVANGFRRHTMLFEETQFGVECIRASLGSATAQEVVNSKSDGYSWFGKSFSDISYVRVSNPASVTELDIKIYAR